MLVSNLVVLICCSTHEEEEWDGSEEKGLEAKQTWEGVKMVLSQTDLEENRPYRFLVFLGRWGKTDFHKIY